jgi:hypothetical protein
MVERAMGIEPAFFIPHGGVLKPPALSACSSTDKNELRKTAALPKSSKEMRSVPCRDV